MNCLDVEKNIPRYIDKQFSRIKKYKFKKHISSCENCRKQLTASTEIFKRYAELSDVTVSEDVKDKIFDNLSNLPIEDAFPLKSRLAELFKKLKARFNFIPKVSPAIKIAFTAVLILVFVFAGINHYKKIYQDRQNELLKIFERKPFFERTYDLSIETKRLKLAYKLNNGVVSVHKKIEKLKTKHDELIGFSTYDINVNKLKNRLNQIKSENFFRRKS